MVHELGEAHELGTVHLFHHEGVEIVAALLAITDNIDACVLLVLEALQYRLVGDLVELGESDAPGLALAQSVQQPRRAGPASYYCDGE